MADAKADDGVGHKGGALQTAKDLFAGAMGGIAQVLIGTSEHLLTATRTNADQPPQANPLT